VHTASRSGQIPRFMTWRSWVPGRGASSRSVWRLGRAATVVVEELGIGGQAGTSSLIRNYLGFPRGIAGGVLAHQAIHRGTELSVTSRPQSASACHAGPRQRSRSRCLRDRAPHASASHDRDQRTWTARKSQACPAPGPASTIRGGTQRRKLSARPQRGRPPLSRGWCGGGCAQTPFAA
jgi:hypothetical protein